MWNTSTFWFDTTLVFFIFAVGNILFGHFEEHKPKWQRLLKVAIVLALGITLSHFNLRWLFYSIIGLLGMLALYIHTVWLPKHGINGWTGEPKDKYLELVNGKRSGP